ncbi:response regulator [Fulvivirga ligni]|uniref:response regulator n=1 Tax=Fulvivirga ligni TaxID=2904246 RepID=UPI001F48E6F4|nr:response regulator [Fulvivirga ligni]UII21787.1 response regulator [Fulvivirga ligni]
MSKNILVVDDSYYMRAVLRIILEDAGYTVVNEAASGQEAIQCAKDDQPDLVTLDLILPDNSGLDVLKTIKQNRPDQKVVVVSAVGQESIVKQAEEIGAAAYITKPFEDEEVVKVINNVFM